MGCTERCGTHRLSYDCSVENRQDADLGLSEVSLQDRRLSPQTSPGQGLGDIEVEREPLGHRSLEPSGLGLPQEVGG